MPMPNRKSISTIQKWLLLGLLAFFTVLMIRISIPYLALEDGVAFLRIKKSVIDNSFWKLAFYVHVFTSTFLLLAGFTQFSNHILKRYKKLHRSMGYAYVLIILLLSGPAGIVMGVYANGGLSSRIAFCLLGVLWWIFTFQALWQARKRNFVAHRRYMIYSFALTLSAITLRAWKWLIVALFQPQPMDVYMIVAWLGWVPNLLIAIAITGSSLTVIFQNKRKPKY